jgi:dimeric dUTPase (all-alpha-NTP-PPase superfamily)
MKPKIQFKEYSCKGIHIVFLTALKKSPTNLAVSKVSIRPNPSERFPVVSIRITANESVTRAIPPN